MERNSKTDGTPNVKPDMGRRLRAYRTREGLSIRRLALMTGVDRTSINDIELGRLNTTVDTLSKLADGLGIELGMLFVDEDRIVPKNKG
ncbi:XRE family transcriptional regulator [Gordonibacter sp. 28C]|uniref:helix-turn-helix domain-containing protein n=1 Tax=Gordonibacter sp. 28C TaxID=2078569 RepID=UPI000DF737B4|nr:XRE family transcriptional regulator [Gordonibacter sp. 28C]